MISAADTARLFLALWPGAEVRTALAAHRDTWAWPAKVAPMRAEKLHLTLHFIGDVARHRLPELQRELRVGIAPFQLRLGAPELWPHGIAVLRPSETPPELLQLRAALGCALQNLDLPVDPREFHSHVTLARRAFNAALPPAPAPILWPVQDYVLVESAADARRSYRVLQRYD